MNTFTLCTDQESNGEEEIADIILFTKSCSINVDNVGHKNSNISAEISDDVEWNDIGDGWLGIFYEYDINDQLDRLDCHFPEIDEEAIDIFQVIILIANMIMICTF